jgi:hypothetical protein
LKIEAEVYEQLSNSTIYRRIEEERQQGDKLHRKLPNIWQNTLEGIYPALFSGVTIVVVSKVTSYRLELCVSPL